MTSASATPRRLYLFQLSTATIPVPGGTMEMSTGCYLIETTDGRHILVDSGLPPGYTPPPGSPLSRDERTVLDHLAALGLGPERIDTVICTHLDVDHAGHHDAFPGAEFVIQREHYALARGGHRRFAAARDHWDHPALRYRLIEGDTELLPGLTLLATGGHVPGHQSVLVRLPRTGPVLLAIDAVVMERLFTPERRAWPADSDEAQLRASTRKLLAQVEEERVALTVFGHDGRQWRTLKKAPDFYE